MYPEPQMRAAAGAPERVHQIPTSLSQLASEVQNVSALVEQIERRLEPVLQATSPTAPSVRGDVARLVSAPMVENLNGLRDSLYSTCERMRSIMDRLEV